MIVNVRLLVYVPSREAVDKERSCVNRMPSLHPMSMNAKYMGVANPDLGPPTAHGIWAFGP